MYSTHVNKDLAMFRDGEYKLLPFTLLQALICPYIRNTNLTH